jgi:hypothetical protein
VVLAQVLRDGGEYFAFDYLGWGKHDVMILITGRTIICEMKRGAIIALTSPRYFRAAITIHGAVDEIPA